MATIFNRTIGDKKWFASIEEYDRDANGDVLNYLVMIGYSTPEKELHITSESTWSNESEATTFGINILGNLT